VGSAITLRAAGQAELVEIDDPPVGPDEIAGSNVVSLISPGTELAYYSSEQLAQQLAELQTDGRPFIRGYPAVFRIDETGSDVRGLEAGQLVYCMGGHRSRQCHPANMVVPLPEGLDPAEAVFARIAGVSMTTLVTTTADHPGRSLCSFSASSATSPHKPSRPPATKSPPSTQSSSGSSLHASAVSRTPAPRSTSQNSCALGSWLSARATRTPSCRRANSSAKAAKWCSSASPGGSEARPARSSCCTRCSHRYVHLRGGWEWELPLHDEAWRAGSILKNHALALRWINERRLRVDRLAEEITPAQAQDAYQELLRQEGALTRRLRWGTDE
jgi:hypothetical protein